MSATFQLLLSSGALAVGAYVPGLLPLLFPSQRSSTRHAGSLAAGLLVGAGLCVIVPEGFKTLEQAQSTLDPSQHVPPWSSGAALLLGFLLMVVMDSLAGHQHRKSSGASSDAHSSPVPATPLHTTAAGDGGGVAGGDSDVVAEATLIAVATEPSVSSGGKPESGVPLVNGRLDSGHGRAHHHQPQADARTPLLLDPAGGSECCCDPEELHTHSPAHFPPVLAAPQGGSAAWQAGLLTRGLRLPQLPRPLHRHQPHLCACWPICCQQPQSLPGGGPITPGRAPKTWHLHASHSHAPSSPRQALIGLVLHSMADGLAVGAAALSDSVVVTVTVVLSIMVHKMPVSYGLVSLLCASGSTRNQAHTGLLCFALAAPLTAILTFFVIAHMAQQATNPQVVSLVLLASGGTVLHAGAVHVLPAAGKDLQDVVLLSLASMVPLVASWLGEFLEHSGKAD